MTKRILFILLAVVLALSISLIGCTSEGQQEEEEEEEEEELETLKVGVIAWLGWPIGLDMVNGTEIIIDEINQQGGLDIGGQKYEIELIVYDSGGDQATETSLANRLVYEDEVEYILTDGMNVAFWLDVTDPNKVVVIGGSADPTVLSPDWNYYFNAGPQNCAAPVILGWIAQNYPDIETIVAAYPDNMIGQIYSGVTSLTYDAFGLDVIESIFYPADAQDLSAVGTQVANLNPDGFIAVAGGPLLDSLCYKAVYQAGYEGQFLCGDTKPYGTMVQITSAESLEGFIGGAWAVEFDPALTDQAKDFKSAYIAEYGEWTGPEVMYLACWACLREAMEQAGSTDVDEVAAVIGGGLQFESPAGSVEMVSRPDLGNDRTVDAVAAYYIKEVVDGEPTLLHDTTLEEAVSLFRTVYPG